MTKVNKKLLQVAALLVVARFALKLQQRSLQRRDQSRRAEAEIPAQRWEAEGGALPVSGPQLGPEPSVKPANAGGVETAGA